MQLEIICLTKPEQRGFIFLLILFIIKESLKCKAFYDTVGRYARNMICNKIKIIK